MLSYIILYYMIVYYVIFHSKLHYNVLYYNGFGCGGRESLTVEGSKFSVATWTSKAQGHSRHKPLSHAIATIMSCFMTQSG